MPAKKDQEDLFSFFSSACFSGYSDGPKVCCVPVCIGRHPQQGSSHTLTHSQISRAVCTACALQLIRSGHAVGVLHRLPRRVRQPCS